MTHQKYTTYLLCFVIFVLLVVGVINRLVDPFWYYQDFEISGFNEVKPKFRKYERYIKPKLVARSRPNALIFGSSYSEIGFDPSNPSFTDNGKLKGYNFGIAGAGWERVQCYIDYALKVAEVNRMVIGIAPDALPLSNCIGVLPEIENFSEFNLLFSMKAIDASVGTMLSQHARPSHKKDGMYYYIRGHAGIDNQFREFYRNHEKRTNCDLNDLIKLDGNAAVAERIPTEHSGIDISGLLNVVKQTNSKNIKLRIYIYPSHALWQEIQIMCGNYKRYWSNLIYIVQEVEKLGGDVQIWDFNQFNQYTTEEITNQSAVYWQDPEHFNYEYGELMLDSMFGQNPKLAFGSRLTSDNIQNAYQEYMTSRNNYLKTHQEFMPSLKRLIE
ncbi:hypothetical protein NP590_08775 [Methylomonas sp. SURF-2]|uniref:SGNH hydrolase-type esterase domain-containing protein n=1 Tax=Methylomonas subterranea TaxID=2952225 RepID=A0ABT1TFE9_9GAMM|nr:hypothetical protein [Methylomonas sp. SURF-2]MCQ8104196.1 hypothetical protein [Methylomonas sp. SURF-2]